MARSGGVSGVAVLLCVVPAPADQKAVRSRRSGPRGGGLAPQRWGSIRSFAFGPVMKGDEVIQAQELVPVTFTVHR